MSCGSPIAPPNVKARLAVRAGTVTDLDRRIAQIDSAVEESTRCGRPVGAMSLAADQRKARADLVATRVKEAKTLAGLQVEHSEIDSERKTVEADTGPVRYLAQLIGATDEATMRYFILVVAALLDPAAVLLLLAATARRTFVVVRCKIAQEASKPPTRGIAAPSRALSSDQES
jgi:hypothetical protein